MNPCIPGILFEYNLVRPLACFMILQLAVIDHLCYLWYYPCHWAILIPLIVFEKVLGYWSCDFLIVLILFHFLLVFIDVNKFWSSDKFLICRWLWKTVSTISVSFLAWFRVIFAAHLNLHYNLVEFRVSFTSSHCGAFSIQNKQCIWGEPLCRNSTR